MTRNRSVSRPVRVLLLSAAISAALFDQAQAQSNPFLRRGGNPGEEAARAAQRQGLQSVQAQQMAQKSLQAFQRAAQLRASLDAVQAAARAAAAQSGGGIPDGLVKGGLKVVDNVIVDTGPIQAGDPRLSWNNIWFGAKDPKQTVADGQTQVTIEQTQKKAILNWETFNVGTRTTVKFDQSAGGKEASQWIALNRVNDPNAAPSRILGRIEAEGQVYLLNRNGVVFGGASQVNTHSLLASSLDLFSADIAQSNQKFLGQGLRGGTGLSDVLTGIEQLQQGHTPGDIRIEAGARIGTGAGGYSLIVGANVENAGSVSAQDGQAMLVATALGVRRDTSGANTRDNRLPLTFEGFFVGSETDLSGTGRLVNTGIVSSKRGDATLVGYRVEQRGLVSASTSISRPGSISLLALDQIGARNGSGLGNNYGGVLELGKDSVTSIVPELDGETTTSGGSADKAFVPPSMTLAGAQVGFRENSLVLAPGAKVDVVGLGSNLDASARRPPLNSRILMETGSTINVAGLADVQLDMSSNLVEIPRVGQNELADSPNQRNGAFYRQQVVFDRREQGTRGDGVKWVGSPLLNALGYTDQVPRKIDEMLIHGGTVNVIGRDFVMQKGSKIDLDGGFVHFLGGMVETQRLLGADGRVYDLSTADPMLNYVGFAGEQRLDHSRWGVSETYTSPLVGSRRYYESDYVQGGNAGTLNIELARDNARADQPGALILDGDLSARAIAGRYQVKFGQAPKNGALNIGGNSALLEKAFAFGPPADTRSWQIREDRTGLSEGIGMDTPVASLPGGALPPQDPDNPASWSVLSADMVREAGLGSVSIGSRGVIAVEAKTELQVADGGRIALSAGRVEVQGGLTAHAGEIALTSAGGEVYPVGGSAGEYFGRGDVVVGAGAKLDVSGNWVNDNGLQLDRQVGKAFIDGGSITLTARQKGYTSADGVEHDASGSILLEKGAVLDASSGGYVDASGKLAMRDGRPLGAGGDIALQTYVRPPGDGGDPTYLIDNPKLDDSVGRLQFQDATLRADGFARGGTLALRAFGIRIGGDAPADARVLHLDGGFFDGKAFGGYDLSAETDATIVAGTQVRVSQRNLVPDVNALRRAATGTDIRAALPGNGGSAYATLGQLDPFYRPATDFAMRAGDYLGLVAGDPTGTNPVTGTLLLDRGAQLTLDPGGKVALGGRGQVSVLGDITAHGGSISLSGSMPAAAFNSGSRTNSVWVGADSRLDVSGLALTDPLAPPRPGSDGQLRPRTGKVLDGGSITLSNEGGYVVVEDGAQLDLSGARAVFDLPGGPNPSRPGTDTLQPRAVWSDGGILTLASSAGLFFDGRIAAAGGDAAARGGELHLVPLAQDASLNPDALRAEGIVFEQSGSRLPAELRPGDVVEPGQDKPSGLLYFAADRLQGSGIDTLVAGNQTPDGAAEEASLVPIAFSGNVDLSVARAIQFNAPLYTMLPAGSSDLAAVGSGNQVRLRAAYVGLNGFRPRGGTTPELPTLAQPGATSLTVVADHIDLGGQFALSNVGQASFESRGDIRFHTPSPYAVNQDGSARLGELLSAGDLTFKAAQLYPGSGEGFLVRAVGATDPLTGTRADTRITVLPNGQRGVPLSADGALFFDATTIEQQGTIRAPSGRIVLGITDPTDAAARALFGNRELAATQRVHLADGSLTSVSLEGAILPYGTTVDGLQWRYDTGGNGGNLGLNAPPQKRIEFGGADIALDTGATIDLSGGGDLQAIEWVPGTGGSRDLLSPYNTSYANGGSDQVPLYPDARGVYAIVPGLQSPVAATDPIFDKGASPAALGRAVYLSGVPGLPDGVYTLLPAKYATLPGALRVVQRPGTQDATSTQNLVLPDGSVRVSGYFVDGLTGARDARSTQFEVQSRQVWGQYSEYTVTGANRFFADLAARGGKAAPQLARDAGQLILSATRTLDLGATLKTGADKGGAAAQIDIASRALQVRDTDHDALAGYVQLDVNALNALGAGSLLIGGIREQTAEGTRIDVKADSVVVSNDAADPLHAPEILLAAAPSDGQGAGLRIEGGSAIEARGDLSAGNLRPILIGREADAAKGIAAVSGDGALLRLSNAGEAPIVRANVPVADQAQGRLEVGADAQLHGGASLTLDSTGDTRVSADALLQGKSIAANAGRIRFDNGSLESGGSADAGGLVIGENSLKQFAAADRVSLRSYGSMDFVGDIDLRVDKALTLSAGTFASDGGKVNLSADRLTIANELGAKGSGAAGTGTLTLGGREVAFGQGDAAFAGFGGVAVSAKEAVVGRGKGVYDFGALDVDVRAPVIRADAGADSTLKTTGALRLSRSAGEASAQAPLGGAWTFVGGSLESDALIRANAGSVDLQATSGDLRLKAGGLIDVSGAEKTFFDTAAYAPGGAIGLRADKGGVFLAEGATLDFSAHARGGDAGSLEVSAPTRNAELLGTLKGGAGQGDGGSFGLDVGGAVDLDALSARLAASGIDEAIAVKTRAGNLVLSEGHALHARRVSLVADGGEDTVQRDAANGNVIVDGSIDASGTAGGSIDLWGRHGVAVNGSLLAKGSAADQRGGTVRIGTSGHGDGTLDAEHGYQNVDAGAAGIIALGEHARIDVSGGTVEFRAPLLRGGEVNVTIDGDARIAGAREVGMEAYAVWSTTDASTDPGKHFDGIIDPAGWYDAKGELVDGALRDRGGNLVYARAGGVWRDAAGNPLSAPPSAEDMARYFFTPDAANADHSRFYGYLDEDARTPGTLMGFVQRPGFAFEQRFAHVANFRARAGIELRNPDADVNGGAVSVLTGWNLGSGETPDALDYRYNGNAPVLTLRAQKDVVIKASLSDGFFQLANKYGGGGPQSSFGVVDPLWGNALNVFAGYSGYDFSALVARPTDGIAGDPAQVAQYYAQYKMLLDMLLEKPPELGGGLEWMTIFPYFTDYGIPVDPGLPGAPPPPTGPADYENYLAAYRSYLLAAYNAGNSTFTVPEFQPPALPVLGPVPPGKRYNAPSLQARIDNPLPLATATLIGGDSSRYRIVAGADLSSVRPDAVREGGEGDVVLDGHRRFQEAGRSDVLTPTTVRTGTGEIDMVAANDLRFADVLSPASIYTAGRPVAGTQPGVDVEVKYGEGQNDPASSRIADVVVGANANAEAAGDILLEAGRDILGNRQLYDVDGSITGLAGNYIAQYWWPWLQVGNPLNANQDGLAAGWINFGGFAQGVMSVGGNVRVRADRDIRELSVSLPSNYVVDADASGGRRTYGGGNLEVAAGRDVLGGDYYVAKGAGTLKAGGSLGSAFTLDEQGPNGQTLSSAVAPVFAVQGDSAWSIQAGRGAEIGAIVNPMDLDANSFSFVFDNLIAAAAETGLGAGSAIDITAIDGDLRMSTLLMPGALFGYGARGTFPGDDASRAKSPMFDNLLPASLRMAALGGGLTVERGGRLYPSALGQLQLLAEGDIALHNVTGLPGETLTMLDVPLASGGDISTNLRDQKLNLHRDDAEPVRIYSAQGDIVNGLDSEGMSVGPLTLDLPKPARIRAGRDIVNLDLRAQNYAASDITQIAAGRDLYYTPARGASSTSQLLVEVGGPGLLEVQAGRNIGPLNPYDVNTSLTANTGGFRTIGDRDNAGLPADGADIAVRFGVGPGIATGAFAARYLDPAAADATDAYRAWLSEFVLRLENDRLRREGRPPLASMSPEEAWTAFGKLSAEQRQPLVDRVFLDILKQVGIDYQNPASPDYRQYRRGYEAINTLFPAQYGYTANNLEGGENGAAQRVRTGSLDMRGSTLQTQRGGDVRIIGPGGGVLVGSAAAAPIIFDPSGNVIVGPKDLGILAMQAGDIGLFTDDSVLLAQSRVFTQRGGDLTMWSSNGDINAGKGAKTSSEKSRNAYLCDTDHFCQVDASGQISGAGIAASQTDPDGEPGDAVLVAPRGTVDAGDAGIRVSGNLIVAAQFVANADNIQVQGETVGVQGARGTDSGALTAASSAASAVSDAAGNLAEQRPAQARDVPAVISVQVIGFGNCAPEDPRCKARQ
ncbi:filamentous haemagglutinin family protein [Luteimonas aquatica]|uniref:filamentous haemagglutinin family protein n=1 Tax=Luteimonas aquatica TaxID=450364 RepID=UPI001F5ACA22|nr:filamentous haemagglutinin family protein [Luteimonas aquatica]